MSSSKNALQLKASSSSSLSALAPTSQSSQNLSSHVAPPAKMNNPKKGSFNKKRESKGQQRQKSYQDDFDLDLQDQISGKFKTKARRGQSSINHLLDFGLPSKDLVSDMYNKPRSIRPRRRSSNTERINLTGPEFINANYRFVVDETLDYKGQILDPNLTIPDIAILRVIVPKGHHCPICLSDEIIAPRMSSCGHIFCHSCLLSFFESEQIVKKGFAPTRYKECPLCSNFVKPHEIKPVLFNKFDERFETPKIGQDIVMKLMARPMGSILPLPFGLNLNHKKFENIPYYSDSEIYPYARILKGGLKFAVDNYEREKLEILNQHEQDKLIYQDTTLNDKFINKAIEEIDFQIKILKDNFKNNFDEPNLSLLSIKDDIELNDSNCYFFYQTAFNSTIKYFLSPLDTRILLRTYGAYCNFPSTLLLNVENINSSLMVTESILKKFKFMNHLPLGTELALLEINWSSIKLPNEVFQEFKKDLVERQKKVKNKLKREDIAKKNYENYQELKNIEFYQNESNNNSFSHENLPVFYEDLAPAENNNDETISTIWGTKIPTSKVITNEKELQEDIQFDEIIKKAKEENVTKKTKGKKKKLVLLTSTARGGY